MSVESTGSGVGVRGRVMAGVCRRRKSRRGLWLTLPSPPRGRALAPRAAAGPRPRRSATGLGQRVQEAEHLAHLEDGSSFFLRPASAAARAGRTRKGQRGGHKGDTRNVATASVTATSTPTRCSRPAASGLRPHRRRCRRRRRCCRRRRGAPRGSSWWRRSRVGSTRRPNTTYLGREATRAARLGDRPVKIICSCARGLSPGTRARDDRARPRRFFPRPS